MHKTLRAKCILLGSAACGKSSIVQTFCSDGRDFPRNYCMSTGVEVVVKSLIIPEVNDNIELFLYSIPGKDVFQDLLINYVNHVDLLMIVFDVTDLCSFDYAKNKVKECQKTFNNMQILTVIVGNKTDQGNRRQIKFEEAQIFSNQVNIPYFETSAKEALGVEAPFLYLIKQYQKLYTKSVSKYQNMI